MSTLLIYHSPVDFHTRETWRGWATPFAENLLGYRAGGHTEPRPPAVTYLDQPVFSYGRDDRANTAAFCADPGAVAVRPWCDIVFYAATAVLVGDGLDVAEVKRLLHPAVLLNEYPGGFREEGARLRLYGHRPELELRARQLVNAGGWVYLTKSWGPRWEDDPPWEDDWVVHREPSTGVSVVLPQDGRHDHELWAWRDGNELIAAPLASSFLDALALAFEGYDDVELILGRWRVKHPLITFNRCHMDDSYFCTYNLPAFDAPQEWVAAMI